jgi:hypothetical protein
MAPPTSTPAQDDGSGDLTLDAEILKDLSPANDDHIKAGYYKTQTCNAAGAESGGCGS